MLTDYEPRSSPSSEEPPGKCPICGGKVRPRDLLPAHVDYCLTQLELRDKQQQAEKPPTPRGGGGASPRPSPDRTTPATSSSAEPPSGSLAGATNGPQQTTSKAASAGGGSGGLRGMMGLFGRGRRVSTRSADAENEYKRLRKAIVETSLSLCTKREAVQLAALGMRLDIACEERRSKKPKEDLDYYRREKQKPSLNLYYSPHWLAVCDHQELAAELLNELEGLDERLGSRRGQEVEAMLMPEFVAQCQALPFYDMTVFSVLEWRTKDGGGKDKAKEPSADYDAQKSNKEKGKEKKEKRERKKTEKVKYEKVPVYLGITRDCSLIKIDERNEIEMAWRITQVRSYSLMLREGRQKPRSAGGGAKYYYSPRDFILTLDFGDFFPHYLQLLNRRPSVGLLSKGPRQRLRENAMIRLADDSEDAIRFIYVQIHSYIQEATGRVQEDRRRMEERLALYGLKERDVVGDGNCQMRALSYQLFQTEDKHVEVRRAMVKWLKNNAKYAVRDAETGRVVSRLVDFLETDYHRTWDDYCAYMAKDKSWGDHMTLLAAAEVYSVNIWVLSSVDVTNGQGEASEPWTTIEPQLSAAKGMIRLAHWHEKHYSALAVAS